ncbi:hemerythrin domain-containing protein [Methanocella arvoryzae]|uniref:Predicted hemerythrin-like protein n=1 Tax=Methanocella arvoryzae (strain DSM 22066 / NBRC 105507 / MRE50) TaxID=351160 RepID=Q0W8H3_METAR|nr:predicted hemerythrin-like protein [Methanocella arvoryzae MRE50]
MLPIGQLMIEHRLIERMISLMKDEMDWIGETHAVDPVFLETAVYFMRQYTDICHHGKEEDIYFSALEKKPITPELRKTLEDLIEEHAFARRTVDEIEAAKNSFVKGDKEAVAQIIAALNIITIFYPQHIDKEDHHFFYPSMEYFSKEEKDQMLREFSAFDTRLYHDEHKRIVEELERRKAEQKKSGPPSGARA